MDRPPATQLYIAYLSENGWQWLSSWDFLPDEVIPFIQHPKMLPLFFVKGLRPRQAARDFIINIDDSILHSSLAANEIQCEDRHLHRQFSQAIAL